MKRIQAICLLLILSFLSTALYAKKEVVQHYDNISGQNSSDDVDVFITNFLSREASPSPVWYFDSFFINIENNNGSPIDVSFDDSAIIINGVAVKFVDGETRVIDTQRQHPSFKVFPNTKTSHLAVLADGKLKISEESSVRVIISYKQNGKDKFIEIPLQVKKFKPLTFDDAAPPTKKTPAKEGNFEIIEGTGKIPPCEAQEIEDLIILAIESHRNWDAEPTEPYVITAKIPNWVEVQVKFTKNCYWFEYVNGSPKLKAQPEKDKINKVYREWIEDVDKRIIKYFKHAKTMK